jgi:hypothetical protein
MDRRQLRAALSGAKTTPGAGTPGPGRPRAVIAMMERHACRLEQVRWPARTDAEALSRALRSAQRLYDLPAVTVGDGGDLLIDAAKAAAGPVVGGVGDAGQVLAVPAVAVAQDAFSRLRTVLGGRAGVVVVLPAPARLTAEAGLPAPAAEALLLAALHAFGAAEPDAFVLTGGPAGPPDQAAPVHDAVAAFYGAALLRVGTGPGAPVTAGVAVRRDLDPGDGYAGEFAVVTPAEMEPGLTPAEVRTRLAAAQVVATAQAGTAAQTGTETVTGAMER